ncbi:MAG: hypothetical protein ABIO88_06040 [Burkholderiaceae bacterium]
MFTTPHNQATDIQRLQDMAAIRSAAKHRAEQLRQEAMDAFFKAIGVAVMAAARRLTTRGLAARLSSTSQPRALEN